MSLSTLAPEITDSIIDFLHDDPSSLRATASTCRRLLQASRFHLFSDLDLKSHHFSGRPFPANLSHLVDKLQFAPEFKPKAPQFWGFPMGQCMIPPPPPSVSSLKRGLSPFSPSSLVLRGVNSTTQHASLAAIATTPSLQESVKSVSLEGCCLDSSDALTLASSLPHLQSMRFSGLKFDNSRSITRQMERATMMRCWVHRGGNTDWSTITESVPADASLQISQLEVLDTAWSEDLRCMLGSVTSRVEQPSDSFVLRTDIRACDLDLKQGAFGQFLEECGQKLSQLDLSIHDQTKSDELKNSPSTVEMNLENLFLLCPNLTTVNLSGRCFETKEMSEHLKTLPIELQNRIHVTSA